jgi:hypothetical protein
LNEKFGCNIIVYGDPGEIHNEYIQYHFEAKGVNKSINEKEIEDYLTVVLMNNHNYIDEIKVDVDLVSDW